MVIVGQPLQRTMIPTATSGRATQHHSTVGGPGRQCFSRVQDNGGVSEVQSVLDCGERTRRINTQLSLHSLYSRLHIVVAL
jgi:hypothetical protein